MALGIALKQYLTTQCDLCTVSCSSQQGQVPSPVSSTIAELKDTYMLKDTFEQRGESSCQPDTYMFQVLTPHSWREYMCLRSQGIGGSHARFLAWLLIAPKRSQLKVTQLAPILSSTTLKTRICISTSSCYQRHWELLLQLAGEGRRQL